MVLGTFDDLPSTYDGDFVVLTNPRPRGARGRSLEGSGSTMSVNWVQAQSSVLEIN